MALRRFIADRGHPKTIYADNGTNLVVGEKELREGIVNLNSKLVTEEMIDRGINRKFSPPSARILVVHGSTLSAPARNLCALSWKSAALMMRCC